MQNNSHHSPTTLAYARSLLELGEERKLPLEAIRQEMNDLRKIIADVESFRLYLADPGISAEARGGVLERALKGKVSPLTYDFIRLLNQKNRLKNLPEIADAFGELLDEKLGKIEVDLTVAHKLSPEQLEDARKRISAALKRDAVIHPYVDENIIGGAVLRIGDKLIDASVKNQLAAMREKLLSSN